MPALVLWFLACVVSTTVLRPFDVLEYERYAHAALHTPLFHHFPLEYPAPALAVFLLPLLLPFSYPWAFAVLAGVALVVLVTTYEGSGLPGWDVHSRGTTDRLPGAGVGDGRHRPLRRLRRHRRRLLSLRAARQGRWNAAWTWSAVGCRHQALPGRLLARVPHRRVAPDRPGPGSAPGVDGGHRAARGRGSRAARPQRGRSTWLHYYLHRPTEDGSAGGGIVGALRLARDHVVSTFHSVNVVSAISGGLGIGHELAGVGACVWVWWQQVRGRLSLEAACLATLTFVVLGSKVLLGAVPDLADAAVGALPAARHVAARRDRQPGHLPLRGVGDGSGVPPRRTPSPPASRSRSSPGTCSSLAGTCLWLRAAAREPHAGGGPSPAPCRTPDYGLRTGT